MNVDAREPLLVDDIDDDDLDDDEDDSYDTDDDEEDGDDEEDDEEEEETWQVSAGGPRFRYGRSLRFDATCTMETRTARTALKPDPGLTSGSELPRLPMIFQLI